MDGLLGAALGAEVWSYAFEYDPRAICQDDLGMMAAESAAPAPAPGTQLFRSLRSLRQAPGASMYYLGKKNEVEEAEKAAETSPEAS